ncbi:hypothetical protein [Streptomyces sp. NPDC056817]|uniref:hypothetical protein n=1 Tax=Streptomyces sp. NPDC056817 TaxID=3345950 RepID=UPI0036BBB652
MAIDALDPGPNGDYPHFPRLPDGSPAWSDLCSADYHGSRMPRGVHRMWDPARREWLVYDVTPRDASGNPINPPVIPPQ